MAETRKKNAASLQLFLEKEYGPWVKAHRKTGAETLERLETAVDWPDSGDRTP